jgi:hypothetical protein
MPTDMHCSWARCDRIELSTAQQAVKKALTMTRYAPAKPNFVLDPHRRGLSCMSMPRLNRRSSRSARHRNGVNMSVVAYVLLTVAVFAVLGLAQKLVEKL